MHPSILNILSMFFTSDHEELVSMSPWQVLYCKESLCEIKNGLFFFTKMTKKDIGTNFKNILENTVLHQIGPRRNEKKNEWMTYEVLQLMERERESKGNPDY
ncbi:hypothetical protein HHI36_019135 [Cryptolaemus montrouzieri]|uniref:Uncharacterized protein n=1 Tax=Cryptolaemus montrouzieri TaxID=559131 RepID=A0ABD2P291_9CUCU